MNEMRNRAKDNFPMVLVTLLSILQALALELLWGQVHQHPEFYELSWTAVLGWMRVTAVLAGILVIWLVYASNAMRFRWVPSTMDSVYPFLVGILQFVMIDSLGPEHVGRWLLILAVIFALMTWLSQSDLKRARADGENAVYFDGIPPARWTDFIPAMVTIVFLAVSGLLVWERGDEGWVARIAVTYALVALLYQLYLTDKFWRRSMGAGRD